MPRFISSAIAVLPFEPSNERARYDEDEAESDESQSDHREDEKKSGAQNYDENAGCQRVEWARGGGSLSRPFYILLEYLLANKRIGELFEIFAFFRFRALDQTAKFLRQTFDFLLARLMACVGRIESHRD